MKCRKQDCHEEAAPMQGYCCREHAPYANLSSQAPPEKTVKALLASITPARGELSKPSSDAEPSRENGTRSGEVIRATPSKPENKNGGTTVRTETASTPISASTGTLKAPNADVSFQRHGWNEEEMRAKLHAERGDSGTEKTETDTSAKNAVAVTPETQPVKRVEPSTPSNGEPLISMDLIDDSMTHLHGLMKGIATEAKDAEKRRLDPSMVNAACNCAKNIYGLMRLKFDVLKESRKRA